MNVTPEKMEWLREGATVYTLMHDRWSKGEEQFRNRIWFGVYTDKDAGVSREDAAAFIVKAVNAHDRLVEALRNVIKAHYSEDGDTTRAVLDARAALAAAGEQV